MKTRSVSSQSPTPLWVISLFVSLTEIVVSYSLPESSGYVKIALTGFSIIYPILIAGGFFYVLWHRFYVFWPPSEFGNPVDFLRIIDALRTKNINQKNIHDILKDVIDETLKKAKDNPVSKKLSEDDLSALIKDLNSAAYSAWENSVITVLTNCLPAAKGEPIILPYIADRPIHYVLDEIWFEICDFIPAYSYGTTWLIQDINSGKFYDVGRPWARQKGLQEDERSLKDLGIKPGAKLRVIPG